MGEKTNGRDPGFGSTRGPGCTFLFHRKHPDAASSDTVIIFPVNTDRPPRILVVEDDEALRLACERLFAAAGYEVLSAGGVYEALRAVQRATPDVVLADLMLPDGDGMGLTRALRAIAGTVGVPVVAVTASARSIDLLEPASFGAERILLKPVADDVLLAAVSEVLVRRGRIARAGSGATPGSASGATPGPQGPVALQAPDGTQWTVHLTRARDASGRDALLFVSKGGYHRVTEFPPDWHALPETALWALGNNDRG